MFITLEGPDGAGKTTQAKRLAELLRNSGKSVTYTREPGGTGVGDRIRDILKTPSDEKIYPETEALLLFASRIQHVRDVIVPALTRGDIVVCDRFTDSTYAYQCGGRGLNPLWIKRLEGQLVPNITPDFTLVLDVDYLTSIERVGDRGEMDRFESEGREFFERTRNYYISRVNSDNLGRYHLFDARLSEEVVERAIFEWAKRIGLL